MRWIIIVGLLLVGLLIVGCDGTLTSTSNAAYFDMPCNTSCNVCDMQQECDNICYESGIRIRQYKQENTIQFEDGAFICKCY